MDSIQKVIFVGGLWENDEEVIRISKGSVQFAANTFQNNIIHGIDCVCEKPTTVVTGLFLGSYPKRCRKLFFRAGVFNHSDDDCHRDYRVGFCNFTGVKHISLARSLTKAVARILEDERTVEGICVCGYAMTFSIVKTLVALKSRFPKICTCLIVPDLPQYMDLGAKRRIIRTSIKNIVNRSLFRMIQKIDCFTVLTKYMCKELLIEDKPHCVVEGIAPIAKSEESKCIQKRGAVVYTGSLDKKYGIVDLVESFNRLNRIGLYLDIYGYGDSVPYILEQARLNPRIRYWGNVDNEIAREAQRNAMLLVNPRSNNEEYTRYSFPSKTLEYMSSGTAVLMCRLPGVPEEYYSHVFSFEDNLFEALEEVVSLPEEVLREKGLDGKKYVCRYKNAVVQSRKIVSMLEVALQQVLR